MIATRLQGIAGEQFAHPGWEVPVSVMELVELLPVCGLSMSLLFTRNQIEVLIELTSDGKHSPSVTLKARRRVNIRRRVY